MTAGTTAYYWGGQVEQMSNRASSVYGGPSSFIRTVGSNVTRQTDQLTIPQKELDTFFNWEEGTFVAEASRTKQGTIANAVLAMNNGGTGYANMYVLYEAYDANGPVGRIYVGGNGTFGSSFQSPTLYTGDTQASGSNGGSSIKCTKGVYWAQQGSAPCVDVAVSGKFRISNGTEITNTANIERGYKAGYNIIQTAGVGQNNGGNGGNGVVGGSGGGFSSGGGGGSGYTDGSVTIVATQQGVPGGLSGPARIIIRIQT